MLGINSCRQPFEVWVPFVSPLLETEDKKKLQMFPREPKKSPRVLRDQVTSYDRGTPINQRHGQLRMNDGDATCLQDAAALSFGFPAVNNSQGTPWVVQVVNWSFHGQMT
ncbi:hypothetical protein CEXT_604391 [Caerostris extrusa]|uniref:Uncharacterized protein n=1 Tax=Caerostris extrusa TaxID=172846 RepID=A0AAV4RDB5_CAEEX|nr:hypothetical protein CEXT_604391 [Caerostris extrusa]